MSRGPQPLKAKEESWPVAEKRGLVMRYQHRHGNICDFSIMSPGLVCFVCSMRLLKISSTPEDIAHDYAKVIGQLRFIASTPAISRELWLRSPRGAWRFFRIYDLSLVEIGPDGMPLTYGRGSIPCTSPVAETKKSGTPGSAGQNGKNTAVNERPVTADPEPGKDPEAAAIVKTNSVPAPDPVMQEPEKPSQPDTIPDLIRKFLKRKKKGLDKDPESTEPD